jgi:hypothetical protein
MFLLGILIFKRLTARRLYKSFGVKGLMKHVMTVSGLYSNGVRASHDTMTREKKLEVFYLFVYF